MALTPEQAEDLWESMRFPAPGQYARNARTGEIGMLDGCFYGMRRRMWRVRVEIAPAQVRTHYWAERDMEPAE